MTQQAAFAQNITFHQDGLSGLTVAKSRDVMSHALATAAVISGILAASSAATQLLSQP